MSQNGKKFQRIPQSLLSEANTRISLVSLISQSVPLTQASKDKWKGLCPFHQEKNPSFFIDEEKGYYHCFGCGESGNAINFLMKAQGMEFRQAAMHVLYLAGLEFYDAVDWVQNESSMIKTSVDKTVYHQQNEENDYLGGLFESLHHISRTCHGILVNDPKMFDKIEGLYLMVDDNLKFQNYERIYDICKNLIKEIGKLKNDPV